MPYTINKYNGTVVATVADGTIDSTTDLKLIGKNYAGYGEVQNENFLFLLENFANTNQPPKPLPGQIWFDTGNSKLKFYDGAKFRTTGGAELGTSAPTGLTVGDFWWDTTNQQLYTWNGASYILVGPQGVAGSQTTQMRSKSVRDTQNSTHAIIEAIVDGDTIFVVSADSEFTLDSNTSAINGYTKIHQGITLAYTNSDTYPGQTVNANHRFWGTATNSDRLGGTLAADFVKAGNAQFNTTVKFSDTGFTIGDTPKLHIYNNTVGATPFGVIENEYNDTIKFQTKVGGGTKIPMQLIGPDILPGSDAAGASPSNIGSGALRFNTVSAVTFDGTATKADTFKAGYGDYRTGSESATSGAVAIRTSNTEVINGLNITAGALKATYFVGTALAANYADLAEMYLADAEYDVGTVMMVGGEKEITAAQVGFRAIGAVSANPAYLMNKDLEGGTIVALKGRIPVKVIGNVIKGQRLIAAQNGTAQAAFGNTADYFAIALESSEEAGIKLIECIIL